MKVNNFLLLVIFLGITVLIDARGGRGGGSRIGGGAAFHRGGGSRAFGGGGHHGIGHVGRRGFRSWSGGGYGGWGLGGLGYGYSVPVVYAAENDGYSQDAYSDPLSFGIGFAPWNWGLGGGYRKSYGSGRAAFHSGSGRAFGGGGRHGGRRH